MDDTLNDAQQVAVQAANGPVLIVAGPGTGKTKTLTARIRHLINTGQAKPSEILALTFTKKAAEEMRARLGAQSTSGPDVMTFHALAHRLLGGEFEFISEPKRLQLIKKLPKPAGLKPHSTRELGLLLSRAKNLAEDSADIKRLLTAYNTALKTAGLVDFDDLLVRCKQLLEEDATKRGLYRYILVDEFQDTNCLQYELLQLLRGDHANVFVIGDPKQSIYGFRGASGDIFAQFMADFPHHTRITLTTNYRSAPEVVRLANALFADAPDLVPHQDAPGNARAIQVLNEYSEANWVVNEIQRAIGGGDMLQAVSDDERATHRTLRDFAVLYRSRSAGLAVQKAIAASGLPYQVVGDGSPYDQPQLLALISLLQAAASGEEPELEGFSAAEKKAVLDLLGDITQAVPRAIGERLIHMLGFDMTPELVQFVNLLTGFKDIQAAVNYFDEISEQGFYDPNADAITLLTIHASKGLEFSHVFLVGAEEGLLPHERADEAEERRLFYVAATRAKYSLDILHTKHRGGVPSALSRFASSLPNDVLPKTTDPNLANDQKRAQKRAIKRSQQSLF